MTYFAKKLTKELKLSSLCYSAFAELIIDYQNIKIIVADKIYKDTQKDIENFIKKYEPYIQKVCNNRQYYLKDEIRDCEQFIKMYLCILYHKKYKYSNFTKVVHSVIKRKTIDFSKARNQDLKGMITETDYLAETENINSFIEQHTGAHGIMYRASLGGIIMNDEPIEAEENYSRDIVDIKFIIDELLQTVKSISGFSKRDVTVMEIIKNNVENGICDLESILKNISENKVIATQEFNILVNKINKFIDEIDKEMYKKLINDNKILSFLQKLNYF